MKRITVLCVAGSLWLLTGAIGYSQITEKSDSGGGKQSPSRYYTSYPRLERTRTKSSGKELSFETLRMLSTGMTKAEVLSRAGSPRHSFKKSRVWVYSATDNWIVELNFSGERVIGINWSRP